MLAIQYILYVRIREKYFVPQDVLVLGIMYLLWLLQAEEGWCLCYPCYMTGSLAEWLCMITIIDVTRQEHGPTKIHIRMVLLHCDRITGCYVTQQEIIDVTGQDHGLSIHQGSAVSWQDHFLSLLTTTDKNRITASHCFTSGKHCCYWKGSLYDNRITE